MKKLCVAVVAGLSLISIAGCEQKTEQGGMSTEQSVADLASEAQNQS